MSSTIIFLYKITKIIFNAGHFQSRQKFTIRKDVKVISVSRNTCKFFYIAVPRCNVFVTNRPINSKTITSGTFKIIGTPSLCLTGPHQRFTSCLITPDPIKRLLLNIRMFCILHKEMHGIFTKCITFTDDRIGIFYFLCEFIPMWELPWHLIRSGIIL